LCKEVSCYDSGSPAVAKTNDRFQSPLKQPYCGPLLKNDRYALTEDKMLRASKTLQRSK
jgi:hypothetical protein